jgi:hypothetical protein
MIWMYDGALRMLSRALSGDDGLISIARNVNGKIIKKDLKPRFAEMWRNRVGLQKHSAKL